MMRRKTLHARAEPIIAWILATYGETGFTPRWNTTIWQRCAVACRSARYDKRHEDTRQLFDYVDAQVSARLEH